MKRTRQFVFVLVAVASFAALLTTPAFAKRGDTQIEASLDVATEAFGGTGSTVGFTVGGGTEVIDNLQIRGDISYYNWDDDVWGVDFEVTRIPVAGGVRYYFPLPPQGLKLFAQGQMELSFDEVEVPTPFGFKEDYDEVNVGLIFGGGINYEVSPEFSIGGIVKAHAIDGSYATVGITGAFQF